MTAADVGVLRVLLADDHRMLRDALRRSLEEVGINVVGEAGDGEEAVRMAEQLQPDVVLMDVTMPDVSGIEATRRIRDRFPSIRVVVLTMHGDPEKGEWFDGEVRKLGLDPAKTTLFDWLEADDRASYGK